MKGSTNSQQKYTLPSATIAQSSKIQIGAKTWLCWGYTDTVTVQPNTSASITVNLPVTSASANTYFPILSRGLAPNAWSYVEETVISRTTTSFTISAWINTQESTTMNWYWMAVITTA